MSESVYIGMFLIITYRPIADTQPPSSDLTEACCCHLSTKSAHNRTQTPPRAYNRTSMVSPFDMNEQCQSGSTSKTFVWSSQIVTLYVETA